MSARANQHKNRRPLGAGGPKAGGKPSRPRDGKERLQKVIAAAGVASRRECEQLIQEGRVEVDGDVVTELGVRVDPARQEVHVDGEPLPKTKRVYYAVNKPEGFVCTARDPSGRPRVTDLVPPEAGRVFNVGRLDMGSEGLILLTNDGELANQLAHPRHGVEKIYHVQVAGHITPETLTQARRGVRLAEGRAHFVGARIKSRHKKSTVLEVVLDEGRNREIRRVLASLGHKVQKLTRVAVGPVKLGEMPPGAYRPLTPQEVRALRESGASAEESRPRVKKKRRGGRPATNKRAQPAEPKRRVIK